MTRAPVTIEAASAALDYVELCLSAQELVVLSVPPYVIQPALCQRVDLVRHAALDVLEQFFLDALRCTPQAACDTREESCS